MGLPRELPHEDTGREWEALLRAPLTTLFGLEGRETVLPLGSRGARGGSAGLPPAGWGKREILGACGEALNGEEEVPPRRVFLGPDRGVTFALSVEGVGNAFSEERNADVIGASS